MNTKTESNHPAPRALIVAAAALMAPDIGDLLMAEGFRTLVAHTEGEAKALASHRLAVAVVNLRMPGSLSGRRIVRTLRSRAPQLPVVVVTSNDSHSPTINPPGLGWPTILVGQPMRYDQLAAAVWDVIDLARWIVSQRAL